MKQAAIILACLVVGLLLLWERNTLLRLGLEIQQLQKNEKALLQTHRELLIEISSLSSYSRIEEIATTQLRMIRPDPQQLVMVLNGRPLNAQGVPQSPGGTHYGGILPGVRTADRRLISARVVKSAQPHPLSKKEDADMLYGEKQRQALSMRVARGKNTLEASGR